MEIWYDLPIKRFHLNHGIHALVNTSHVFNWKITKIELNGKLTWILFVKHSQLLALPVILKNTNEIQGIQLFLQFHLRWEAQMVFEINILKRREKHQMIIHYFFEEKKSFIKRNFTKKKRFFECKRCKKRVHHSNWKTWNGNSTIHTLFKCQSNNLNM